ncbi:MAG: DNA adenine methylase [Gemmatimonadota bacterium]
MRYLGNKTRLIPFIGRAIERLGVPPGVAADPFAGTASVARALKRRGWRVHAGDLMAVSYALQVARVELDRTPRFPAHILPATRRSPGRSSASYSTVLAWLDALPGRAGFLTTHYTPGGRGGRPHGRMYFTEENARRIDAVRERIATWVETGALDPRRAQFLIATLIEAADRVANTTGVYASFVKSWQPNALRPLRLRPVRPTRARDGAGRSTAFLGPARDLLARLGPVDLLYLDPPYNGRQYPAYYHIPELLATGWSPAPPLRGKTGLIPDENRRSDWCRKGRAEQALAGLLEVADARHILFSYNDEGLLDRGAIEAALRARGRADSYRCFRRPYRRYRSDADGPGRRYRRDLVREHLHYVQG